ncbi:hypothetical protein IWQ60_006244 [Tieghemiomyces parasiticus]|uniref:At2g23090-like zinc-binding domain-containing protein n=1 Tax=Tieghemiomyces parasiticus TaxID=78921 RepID=A0A9W8AAT7_9FUNG|nr:hypothetical protein IWQ60_006244 [Tieghemiomyces parasiticus]
MRRERAAKDGANRSGSQLKKNEAAKTYKCKVCMQMFLQTMRPKALQEHAENKHNKKLEECFDNVPVA